MVPKLEHQTTMAMVERMLILFLAWFLLANDISLAMAEKSTYIIHMDKTFMPKAFASSHYWYNSMIDSIASVPQDSGPKHVYTYSNTFHGFTALMSKDELEAIKKLPGFVSAYIDRKIKLDTTRSVDFLKLNAAAGLWPAANYGSDAIIGVIDTGIWPESPSFSDHGMSGIPAKWKGICQEGQEFNSSLCNLKLIGARYFSAGLRAANPGIVLSMNSARDNYGHGTHVAGIAAGNYVPGVSFFGYAPGTARGVAPRARLAVYKVSWMEGSVSSDVLAAIDQAVADGVDVISISLRYDPVPPYEDPIAIASFGAAEKGVFVSFSGGNRGYSLGRVHNSYPWALTVAAGTIDRWFAGTLTLGNGKTFIGWSVFPGRASISNLNLHYNNTDSSCNSSEIFTNSFNIVVICEQDKNYVYDLSSQMDYIARSEARAAIFITDEPADFSTSYFPLPGVVINPKDGAEVIRYAQSTENPTASIKFQQTFFGTKPSPTLSSSSSRGPSRSYPNVLKPDLMAPGVLIVAATYPERPGVRIGHNIFLTTDFDARSGTSMACPHASALAALLKSVHPKWSPAAIKSAMMTTASTTDYTGSAIKDAGFSNYPPATPLGMGAGHIDPNRALDPGLIYDITTQDYVNFTRSQTIAITRSAGYNCSNPSSDINYPSFISFYEQKQRNQTIVKRFRRTLTKVGEGAATYTAKLVAPKGSVVTVSPKTLKFERENQKQSYTMTVRYRVPQEFLVLHGSITWIEDNGKHTVRSPIVLTLSIDEF